MGQFADVAARVELRSGWSSRVDIDTRQPDRLPPTNIGDGVALANRTLMRVRRRAYPAQGSRPGVTPSSWLAPSASGPTRMSCRSRTCRRSAAAPFTAPAGPRMSFPLAGSDRARLTRSLDLGSCLHQKGAGGSGEDVLGLGLRASAISPVVAPRCSNSYERRRAGLRWTASSPHRSRPRRPDSAPFASGPGHPGGVLHHRGGAGQPGRPDQADPGQSWPRSAWRSASWWRSEKRDLHRGSSAARRSRIGKMIQVVWQP